MAKRTVLPCSALEIEPQRALDLIIEMLPIPGLSAREGKIVEFISKKLRRAGIPPNSITIDDVYRRSPLGGEVGNLICRLPGTFRGPRRLLMAHVDTVPLCVGTRPVQKDGYICSGNPNTGLGADDRSGAAAILHAILEIVRRRLPHPPLTFLWPVQEEVGLFGSRFVKLGLLGRPKLCFNWDGNEPHEVTVGATGAYRMHIDIAGVASHAGVAPEKGVSALTIAGTAIVELHTRGWHGLIQKGRIRGTSNIGVITGGNATNVVTPHVSLRAEARSHDPRFRRQIVAAYQKAFARAARQVRNDDGLRGKVTIREQLDYESFRLAEDEPAVIEARRAIARVGMEPGLRVANGGLDANWMTAHGLPTVTLGAGQQQVHTVNERLDIERFLAGCRVALALATG